MFTASTSSTKSCDDCEATNSSPPIMLTYALFSIAPIVISKLLPVPPISAALALSLSPNAYPVPPAEISTSLTRPAVTVMFAFAPEPDPVTFVNETFL